MRSGPEPAQTEQLRPPSIGRSWFVSGLGLGQICSWGSIYYGFPLIAEAMERDLGWSRSSLYAASAACAALFPPRPAAVSLDSAQPAASMPAPTPRP